MPNVPVPPVSYTGTVTPPAVVVNVPDNGGPFDQAYKAAGWAPAATSPPVSPPTSPPPVGDFAAACKYDIYGPVVRTDLFAGQDFGAHEAPIGLNGSYDWCRGAKTGQFTPGGGNLAFTFWGQFFDVTTAFGVATPVTNNAGVRIQVRFGETWAAPSATGAWAKVKSLGIGGGTYDYNFRGAGPGLGTFRAEASGGQSFAFAPGFINHIWDSAWPRPTCPGPNYRFHDRAQVRLIADTNLDLTKAKVVGGVANDWYPNPTATAAIAAGIGIPRNRFITPNWQWFTFTGMTEAELAANPPPAPTQPLT